MKEKVVLAYSGGLDTTAVIPWLKENYDYDVVCCCVNVGQGNEIDGLQERAKLSGAEKLYILDVVDEFCDEYVAPCVQANATYENEYLLGTSMARPLIAKKLVEIARKEGAVAVCHGATGKGNDQVRFELAFKALAPDLKIIAPWRCNETWNMKSREDEIEYCKKHGINLPFSSVDNSYSRDRNLWHISHEGLELEDQKDPVGVAAVLHARFAHVAHGGRNLEQRRREVRRRDRIPHDDRVHAGGVQPHRDRLGLAVARKGVAAARADDDRRAPVDPRLAL